MNIFPFGEVDDDSPAPVRFLAYTVLFLRLAFISELIAWTKGIENFTAHVNNWTYGRINRPKWNAYYRIHGHKCDAEKEYIIGTALMTNRGRIALAKAMVEPIRRSLEAPGIAHLAAMRREASYDIANYASKRACDAIRKEEDDRVLEYLSRAAA
jgi:hypothetical protein